jgi:hypothetical protein
MQHLAHPVALPCCRYGFCVYEDPRVTDIACQGLNGMRMGDRTLTVRRATEVRARVWLAACITGQSWVCVLHNQPARWQP